MIQDNLAQDMNDQIKELIRAADQRCSETRGVFDEILVSMVINKCKEAVAKTDPTTSQRAIQAINEELGIK